MSQTFRQTLMAKLNTITGLTAIVGSAIYVEALPLTHDLGRDGPALSVAIPTTSHTRDLMGLERTKVARVQFSAWSYTKAAADAAIAAILAGLWVIPPANPWGDGTILVRSVTPLDESDQSDAPRSGNDQWIYSVMSEFDITYWS